MLAGESRSYADEVEGCYDVRPTHTDEAVDAAAHERLEELLPGSRRVTLEAPRRLAQASVARVEKRDLGPFHWEAAAIEERAGADANVE